MNNTLRLRLALRQYENMVKKCATGERKLKHWPLSNSPEDTAEREQLRACDRCQRESLEKATEELVEALAAVPGMCVHYGTKRYWIWSREDGQLQREDSHWPAIEPDLCLSEHHIRSLCTLYATTKDDMAEWNSKIDQCPHWTYELEMRLEALEAVLRAHGIDPENEDDCP